jgi:hypothetical protein
MPFYRFFSEDYREMAEELGLEELPPEEDGATASGEFHYEPASGRFYAGDLSSVSGVVLDELRKRGATGLRVRYDGGSDEGFGRPDCLIRGPSVQPVADLWVELADPEFVGRIRAASDVQTMWGNGAELYHSASLDMAARFALDELSNELAVALLGRGFGTGEYEMFGAFTADFATGELVDDPHAPKRDPLE